MESHCYKRVRGRGLITLTRLAQSVERTPFKRVVVGSSPTPGGSAKPLKKLKVTRLAQLVERTPFKRVVVGSSPTPGEKC